MKAKLYSVRELIAKLDDLLEAGFKYISKKELLLILDNKTKARRQSNRRADAKEVRRV